MKKQSAEKGHRIAADQIIRKIRRMVNNLSENAWLSSGYLSVKEFADDLIAWIKEGDERYQKRKGGLGRK